MFKTRPDEVVQEMDRIAGRRKSRKRGYQSDSARATRVSLINQVQSGKLGRQKLKPPAQIITLKVKRNDLFSMKHSPFRVDQLRDLPNRSELARPKSQRKNRRNSKTYAGRSKWQRKRNVSLTDVRETNLLRKELRALNDYEKTMQNLLKLDKFSFLTKPNTITDLQNPQPNPEQPHSSRQSSAQGGPRTRNARRLVANLKRAGSDNLQTRKPSRPDANK